MQDAFGVERGDIAKRGQEAKLVAQTLERVAGAKQARAARQVADRVASRHTRAASDLSSVTGQGTRTVTLQQPRKALKPVPQITLPTRPPTPPQPRPMPGAVPADIQAAGDAAVTQGRTAAIARQQRQQRRNVALGVAGASVLGGGGVVGADAAMRRKKTGRVHVGG